MTRMVQLTITFDIEVDAAFKDGAWELVNDMVVTATIGKSSTDISIETVTDLLLNDYAQELLELYTQQES